MIQVTQEHIDAGVASDCVMCPVALALWDAGYYGVKVEAQIEANGKYYGMSPKLADWIETFDQGLVVAPVTLAFTEGNVLEICDA